ncbi:hypothetical protein IT6_02705 [Methylacidiphilum caldifontis]|uniref:hypothetical protein n=1 Tax=Methylacidiphilum caldifontis TaxID=2795386 RepID=UPI001A8D872A|nr:hypothetical protein [Methylacidiphilum caldifontis]QSR89213.1 hypothetical protein IT6_02705 [Methylacidiphilum caldifontis]
MQRNGNDYDRPNITSLSQKNILLCTLGESWIILIEAADYKHLDEIHCLTGISAKVESNFEKLFSSFEKRNCTFGIWQLKGFNEAETQEQVENFNETLFRWYLYHLQKNNQLPYACIAGGYKSMAAVLHKAAYSFGSKGIFHILVSGDPPKDEENYNIAKLEKRIFYVDLGEEQGFDALHELKSGDFPLECSQIRKYKNIHHYLIDIPSKKNLWEVCKNTLKNISRKAKAWDKKESLPFSILAVAPDSFIDWLNKNVDPQEDKNWIKQLPKIELHCHLGGFATHGRALEEVRKKAKTQQSNFPPPPPLPEGWPEPKKEIGLEAYMKLGNATGSNLLKDQGCLEKHCQLLYEALCDDNVVYAEIRCSPNNYATPQDGRSAWVVLEEIRNYFQQAMDKKKRENFEAFCHVNLVIIADRKSADLSSLSRHLSLAITANQHFLVQWESCAIVGVDLAGFESRETRAELFSYDFTPIHRCGIAVTAHAGENDDAEGIWQAIFKLHARRLGHALSLKNSKDLLRTVVDRKIAIELCPYANYQIKGFYPMQGKEEYPFYDYHKKGIVVTVNTDNIGISKASLSDNFLFLSTKLCPQLTKMDILRIISNSIRAAFLPYKGQMELQKKVEDKLSKLIQQYVQV